MPSPQLYHEEKIPSTWAQIWKHYCARPPALLGLWVLAIMVILSLIGPWLAPFSAVEQASPDLMTPPSWHADGSVRYFFGTDALGRDIWSRLLHGAHLTFGYAALIVVVTMVLGFTIGTLSGTAHGLRASILGHLLDALLSLPSVILALLAVAVLGQGLNIVFWAVGLALLPSIVRTVHNAVYEESQKEYVMAARLDGANRYQLLRYSIFPNIIDTLVVRTTLTFSAAILDIATLGFLGLGAQAPLPEWGAMVRDGIGNVLSASWTVTMPSIAIFIAVAATNLVGDGLRRAINEERN